MAQYISDTACHTRDAQRTAGQQAVRDVAHDAGWTDADGAGIDEELPPEWVTQA